MNVNSVFTQQYSEIEQLSFAPATVAGIEQWTEQLLSLQLGDRCHQLLNALIELQQVKCSVDVRLFLAKAIEQPVNEVLTQLEHFIHQHQYMKFNVRYTHIVELFLLLRCHFIRLFAQLEQAFAECLNRFSFSRFIKKMQLKLTYVDVCSVLLQQCSLLCYHQQQLHHQYYDQQWTMIHGVYQRIVKFKLSQRVSYLKVKGYKLSEKRLKDIYLQILLFAILANHQLNSEDLHRLYQLSFSWLDKIKYITRENDFTKYKVNIASDQPAMLNKQVHSAIKADFYIDCEDLLHYLAQYRNKDNLRIDLVFYLQNLLINTYERKEERYSYSGRANVYIDYTSVTQFLEKHKLIEQSQLLYHLIDYEVDILDKSSSGYRLLWKDDVPEQLQNGECLLLKEQNPLGQGDDAAMSSLDTEQATHWKMAIVRWVKNIRPQVCELGVEVLGHYQIVCSVQYNEQQQSAILLVKENSQGWQWSLLFNANYDQSQVVFQPWQTVLINEQAWRVKLLNVLLSSNSVTQVEVQVLAEQQSALLEVLGGKA